MGGFGLITKLPPTVEGLRRAVKRSREARNNALPCVSNDFEEACLIRISSLKIFTEIADSILILLKNKRVFDAQILLRSQFETLVALSTLVHDPKHFDNIRLENTKRMTRTLNEAEKGNPYFASIAAMDSFATNLEEWSGYGGELDCNRGRKNKNPDRSPVIRVWFRR